MIKTMQLPTLAFVVVFTAVVPSSAHAQIAVDVDIQALEAKVLELKTKDFDLQAKDLPADLKVKLEDARFQKEVALAQADKPRPVTTITRNLVRVDGNEDRTYQNGIRALDSSRWDEAILQFNRVVALGGPRADGATGG